jgi:hypothetical protein
MTMDKIKSMCETGSVNYRIIAVAACGILSAIVGWGANDLTTDVKNNTLAHERVKIQLKIFEETLIDIKSDQKEILRMLRN